MRRTVVIIGAGHAGVQTAASLRDEGFDGDIRLIDAGSALPYQRPPLSKAFLKGEAGDDNIVLRGEGFYRDRAVQLTLGERVEAIDPPSRSVHLHGGSRLAYDDLVLATGARARLLPIPGLDLAGVHALRDLADARRLRAELAGGGEVVVVGAGFIGLEFAAVAARLGWSVTVLEAQDRVMARSVSPAMSAAFEAKHRALGVRLLLGDGVAALRGEAGRVAAVDTAQGRALPARIVVLGVGVVAADGLAAQAGLAARDGVVVDGSLRTSDPRIFAVGDNNRHPNPFFGGLLRLECVQNAVDQGRVAARAILGSSAPYRAAPWFWSDQADFKLQIAGVSSGLTRHVLRGDASSDAFSVFCYEGDRLAVVESLNRPGEHMAARRLIEAGRSPTPEEAADPSFDLKALAARGPA